MSLKNIYIKSPLLIHRWSGTFWLLIMPTVFKLSPNYWQSIGRPLKNSTYNFWGFHFIMRSQLSLSLSRLTTSLKLLSFTGYAMERAKLWRWLGPNLERQYSPMHSKNGQVMLDKSNSSTILLLDLASFYLTKKRSVHWPTQQSLFTVFLTMVRYLVGMVTSKAIFKLATIAIRMMIVAATFPIAIIIMTSLLKGSNPIQQSAAK
jgi:hypothetical protein